MKRAAALLVGLLAGRLVGAQTTASPAPQATTPHPEAALVVELLVADLTGARWRIARRRSRARRSS